MSQFQSNWVRSRYGFTNGTRHAKRVINDIVESSWGHRGGHCTWNCHEREIQKSAGSK